MAFYKDRKRIKPSESWEIVVGLVNPTYVTIDVKRAEASLARALARLNVAMVESEH